MSVKTLVSCTVTRKTVSSSILASAAPESVDGSASTEVEFEMAFDADSGEFSGVQPATDKFDSSDVRLSFVDGMWSLARMDSGREILSTSESNGKMKPVRKLGYLFSFTLNYKNS